MATCGAGRVLMHGHAHGGPAPAQFGSWRSSNSCCITDTGISTSAANQLDSTVCTAPDLSPT